MKFTACVLGCMFDGIEYRGFQQSVVQEIAKFPRVPVWKCLTDEAHPTRCQSVDGEHTIPKLPLDAALLARTR